MNIPCPNLLPQSANILLSFIAGFKLLIYFSLIVTEAILLMKSKSVSETDQYCAMRFKFLALRNNKVLTHFLLETTSTLQYSLSKL